MTANPANSRQPATPPLERGEEGDLQHLNFSALGTKCSVQFVAKNSTQGSAFAQNAECWVRAFEAKFTRFRSDSLVGRINAAAGRTWVEVDAEMENLLDLCDTLFAMTHGVLDPTALPLIKLWDYKAVQPRLPSAAELEQARRLVGWRRVQRRAGGVFLPESGMSLDFGGFGKEYAVDMIAQLATEYGIQDVLVDFGHDVRMMGKPPSRPCWHLGLEDPLRPGASKGSIGVTGKGVASSGDYLRSFVLEGRRYGHIIDPRTGFPVNNRVRQVTVIADTCLQAGVLSTTAFVLGVRDGLDFIQGFPGAEGLIRSTETEAQTRGFFNYVVNT